MRRTFPFLLVAGTLAVNCGDTAVDPRTGGAHINGIVTSSGRPVAGAIVRVYRDGAPISTTVMTDQAGRFCVGAPAFAEVRVTAYLPPPEVVVQTWSGSTLVDTGDVAACGAGPEIEIQLFRTPI